jgi:hypothetical protein
MKIKGLMLACCCFCTSLILSMGEPGSTLKEMTTLSQPTNLRPLEPVAVQAPQLIFNEDVCSICLEPLESEIHILSCRHKLHEKCFQNLQKKGGSCRNQCPECRAPFPIVSAPVVQEMVAIAERQSVQSLNQTGCQCCTIDEQTELSLRGDADDCGGKTGCAVINDGAAVGMTYAIGFCLQGSTALKIVGLIGGGAAVLMSVGLGILSTCGACGSCASCSALGCAKKEVPACDILCSGNYCRNPVKYYYNN